MPRWAQGIRWQSLPKLLLLLATVAVLTALIFSHLDYYRVDSQLEQFRVGQPAPHDILARATLSWEDASETLRQRDEAAGAVQKVYAFVPNAETHARTALDGYFALLPAKKPAAAAGAPLLADLPADVIDDAQTLAPDTLTHLQGLAHGMLAQVTAARIAPGEDTREALARRLETLAHTQVAAPRAERILIAVTKAALQPTWVVNDAATAAQREKARAAVRPQMRLFHDGEVLLHKGDLVTPSLLEQLKAKHLLEPAPLTRVVPLAAVLLFALSALGVYLRSFAPSVFQNDRKLLLLAGLLLAPITAVITLGGDYPYLVALLAIPAGSMAIAGLLGSPVAIVATMLLSVSVGLTADHPLGMVILTLGSALAGIMAVSSIWPASRATTAVIVLIGVNFLLLVSLQYILPDGSYLAHWKDLGSWLLQAGGGAVGAVCFAVGAIYILARPFGITTHYRLMELSNPNEELPRKMMTEAPGSYHSSVMVANIAEAAADAVGANALLTRVAALYHDIGKLKRPGFFVENQAPLGLENMHQGLTPKLSYFILINHVKDGAEIGRQYRLPEEIIQIIREHHGTTLAAYFYHRAVSEAGEANISPHEFRYPGPKPSSREAAIVMLADSVQASVKSLKEPTPGRIENMVHDIINNRLEDGQLENCDLTLRDIRRLSEVFIRILTGLYTYTRIDYPDLKSEGTRPRANFNSELSSATGDTKTVATGS
jgi:putative nucleotidyltransferase with HDIG domain